MKAPLKRNLHYRSDPNNRMQGFDVDALERCLRHSGVRKHPDTGKFGPIVLHDLRRFQQREGLKVDGVYGPATHLVMERGHGPENPKWLWLDGYSAYLFNRYHLPVVLSTDQRASKTAMFTLKYAWRMHYAGPSSPYISLRMDGVRHHLHPPQCPTYEDCSSHYTWCCYVGGKGDPNGFGFNGVGYTGTMILHGVRQASFQAAPLSSAVFYGHDENGNPTHVAMKVSSTSVVSHGSEGGPRLLPWNYRGDLNQIRHYS